MSHNRLQSALRGALRSAFRKPLGLRHFGAARMLLGTNLSPLSTFDGNVPFANIMWQGTAWTIESETSPGTTQWSMERGNVTVASVTGTVVFRSTLYDAAFVNLLDYMPKGTYTVKNPNGCDIGLGAYGDENLLPYGTTTADRTFDNTAWSADNGIHIHLRVTAPGTYGGMKVLIPGADGSDYFNPQLIIFLQGLGASGGPLRFLNWQSTDGNPVADWADRSLPTDTMLIGTGVPWEACFDLANRVGRDPWCNFGPRNTTAYVTAWATLAKATLAAGRRPWVERTNEVWNYAGVFGASTTWIEYENHTRILADVDPSTGVIHSPAHGRTTGDVVLPFSTLKTWRNGITGETPSPSANFFRAAYGAECSVEVVDPDHFKLRQIDSGVVGAYITFPPPNNTEYASSSVTDLIYIFRDEAGAVADLDANYSQRCLDDWNAVDAVYGNSSSAVAVLGVQNANVGMASSRLSNAGTKARANYVAGAPYFHGKWLAGAVDLSPGVFQPKAWVSDAGTATVHVGVYAQGSTPLTSEVEAGTGTGLVASGHQQWTATYAGSGYTSSAGTIAVVNGTTYTTCWVFIDSNGYRWRIDQDVTASGSGTVDVFDSYAHQNQRHLIEMNETGTGLFGSLLSARDQIADIAATGSTAKYIAYECGMHLDESAPASVKTWMRSQTNDASFGDLMKRYLQKMRAIGMVAACWFQDVSLSGLTWKFADSYSDTSDPRYMAIASFAGAVPTHANMAPANITAASIPTAPTLPHDVATLADPSWTYTIVRGNEAGNFDIVGGVLRLVDTTGIDFGTVTVSTLHIYASDGYTDGPFNVTVGLGSGWYEASGGLIAWNSKTDTDNAAMNPDLGSALTKDSGTGAAVAGGYWDFSGGNHYGNGAAMTAGIDFTKPVLMVVVVDRDNVSATEGTVHRFGAYPSLIYTQIANTGSDFIWTFDYPGNEAYYHVPTAAAGTARAMWWFLDGPNSKVYYGYNQTQSNGAGGNAVPGDYTTPATSSRNVDIGNTESKLGSFEVVNRSGMTLTDALAIVQKMQTLHSIT